MAMKCPACGGKIVYNIEKEGLQCEYCDSLFDVTEYSERNDAEKTNEAMTAPYMEHFVCRNCGAELFAPSEQTVAYCIYCGGEATLMDKNSEMSRPYAIIPFSVTKKDVCETYQKELSKQFFLPDEFKNSRFLEGFRGIYIPYWKIDTEYPATKRTLKGKKITTTSKYIYTRYYDFEVEVSGSIDAGYYDASEAFDDTIAAEIAPFYTNESVPFNEGYLAGFYSDMATVKPEKYLDHAEETVIDTLADEIKVATKGIEVKKKAVSKNFTGSSSSAKLVLFPVWFLTWKKGNRVAYAAVNGQTGTLSADLPLNVSGFFISAAILSAVLFALFCALPFFVIPVRSAVFSSVFMYLSSIIFKNELRRIRYIDAHIFDWGDNTSKVKKRLPGKKAFGHRLSVLFSWIIGIFFFIFLITCFEVYTVYDAKVSFIVLFFLQSIVLCKQLYNIKDISNKLALIPVLYCLVAQFAGILISDISRQHDYWYYGLSIAFLIGMILNIVTCIININTLNTRPVPNFFSREGANNKNE